MGEEQHDHVQLLLYEVDEEVVNLLAIGSVGADATLGRVRAQRETNNGSRKVRMRVLTDEGAERR